MGRCNHILELGEIFIPLLQLGGRYAPVIGSSLQTAREVGREFETG
tara:strand:- start:1495 stop:1632 length:138 start_codon:yes stop_codon:yes gene_type:complete